jgi:hypothetical protein
VPGEPVAGEADDGLAVSGVAVAGVTLSAGVALTVGVTDETVGVVGTPQAANPSRVKPGSARTSRRIA